SGLIGTVFTFDDLLSLPIAVGVKISSASVLVGAGSQITGSGDVTLKSESTADANTEAIMADGKLSNALGRFGIAFSVNYAQTEATTLVSEGASVVSAKGNVKITSKGAGTAAGTARVTQNLGAQATDQNSVQAAIQQAGAATVQNRVQLAGAASVAKNTAHTTIDTGALVSAGKSVQISADGKSSNKNSVASASYRDGTAGLTASIGVTDNDIQTVVKGTVESAAPAAPKGTVTFNPFTGVDPAQDLFDFGTTKHNFNTGDAVVYSSGNGGEVGGLESGETYYVIKVDDFKLKLAATPEDAAAGVAIDLKPYPTLGGVPITQVDEGGNALFYSSDTGWTKGQSLGYSALTGKRIGGLTRRATYYAASHPAPH